MSPTATSSAPSTSAMAARRTGAARISAPPSPRRSTSATRAIPTPASPRSRACSTTRISACRPGLPRPEPMEEPLNWRKVGAARGLRIEDLARHVGTQIEGVDLAAEHDEDMVAILRAACVERTLLLFRGQTGLSPAGYLAFANRFGGRPD